MELTTARGVFEGTVNAVLQDSAAGTGSGSIYEAVDRYIRDVRPDVFAMLVDAIKTLQAAGAVPLSHWFGGAHIDGTLDDVVQRYVKYLLRQEVTSAVRLNANPGSTIKAGR